MCYIQRNVERHLTVSAVAKRLQVHPNTIKRYIKTGELRATRYGERGWWRVPLSALDEFMGQQRMRADE